MPSIVETVVNDNAAHVIRNGSTEAEYEVTKDQVDSRFVVDSCFVVDGCEFVIHWKSTRFSGAHSFTRGHIGSRPHVTYRDTADYRGGKSDAGGAGRQQRDALDAAHRSLGLAY